ncbi:hypothetical protein AB4P95_27985 [Pseudomonas sp. A1437]|uniref:hypothetical protein n=1 Tax=unclassified Pseudomonas TaxID=196821 RepID=UPI003784A677
MNIHTIADFEKRLKEIAGHATAPTNSLEMHDGVMYDLPQEQRLLLIGLVKDFIVKTKCSETFSEKVVSNKIKSIFAQILSSPSLIFKDQIKLLADELESFDTVNTVYLRVDGLLVEKTLSLGKVTFSMCDEAYIDSILAPAIFESEGVRSSNALTFEQRIKPEIEKDLDRRCVARVEIIAEPNRAFERAKDEARRVIDILRYSSKFIYPLSEDVRIGLIGDHPRADRIGYVTREKGFLLTSDAVGSPRAFVVDKAALTTMDSIGALELAGYLNEEQLSPFKECLLRAVHWYSSAITQSERENSYLHLMIALETLFTPEKGEPIANTIAESTALIINTTLPGRKQIKKFIKKCYGTRSTIAHGGKQTVSDTDLWELLIMVSNVIRQLTKKIHLFSTQKDVVAYLEDLKFS